MNDVSNGDTKGEAKAVAAAISIVAAALMVVSFFLPYVSANEDARESLARNPEGWAIESIGMTNSDAVDVSLAEYVRIYASDEAGALAAIYTPLFVAILGCSLLALLFSALRKPLPATMFSVFVFALNVLLIWDFAEPGIVPGNIYGWGVAKWVYMAAASAAIAGSIWSLAIKARDTRKARKK